MKAIEERVDLAVRDAFCVETFRGLWLSEGAARKRNGLSWQLAISAAMPRRLKLTPFLRAWPGESQRRRAVTGLECLRAMGSDTALMQLNGIAQKLKFQGLKKKAQEFMEAIAQDRGMSRTNWKTGLCRTSTSTNGARRFRFRVAQVHRRPRRRAETRDPRRCRQTQERYA